MNTFYADLHIHTLLSPCAELEMLPSLITYAAQNARLDIIGITDHNSCENAQAVMAAAQDSGIKVFPGLEVQSLEGIHLLCLFEKFGQAEILQQKVYASLPDVQGADKYYDQQVRVDSEDNFIAYCNKLIAMPSSLDMETIYKITYDAGGVMIPSHIDRRGTGICGVLGMLPESPVFEALEISANISIPEARAKYDGPANTTFVCFSDAHWLSAIGSRKTVFEMESRSISEIRKAFKNEEGRKVVYA